jgi:glycosyltransferase involved in cell wall biosynthesis
MPKKYSLAIVMQKATQFDGPLFAKLARNEQLELKVYYTAVGVKAISDIDPELGIHPNWGEIASSGYEYETRNSGILSALQFLQSIVAAHFDLIIISGYFPIFHSLLALYAWLRRVPVGLRSDTTLQHSKSVDRSLKGLLKKLIFPVFLKIYSTAHPVGTLAQEYLLHYGIDKKQMFLFPYAANNEWFHVKSGEYAIRRLGLRREIGIAEDAFVVLGILKFNEREDPMTLVRGVGELLRQTTAPIHLLLVGDGPLRNHIEDIIHEENILQYTLTGYVPYVDLPKYYAVADVFVHPGIGESWGVSVNESMASGVPVILSDRVGSHIDLVKEGKTGFVFITKNPQSLAQYLAIMEDDRELCEIMGKKAWMFINDWGYKASEDSLMKSIRTMS